MPKDTQNINPSNVNWRYFYSDNQGNILHNDQKPENLPALAILASSLFFGFAEARTQTPQKVKSLITDILAKKPKFCVAVPCAEMSQMVEYYGENNVAKMKSAQIGDEYISIQLHDDLRKGAQNFIISGLEIAASMPTKEGAQQIASAIENGFDIWSLIGGHSLFPKLKLCEEYFAQKAQQEGEIQHQKKSYFIGMSDGSCSQFYLRGLISPINYLGIAPALRSDSEILEKLFAAIAGEENIEFERKLIPQNFDQLKNRYDDLIKDGDVITNVAFFPRQLAFTFDSTFPKFQDNEKIILSIEGFIQSSSGYNAHEVLSRALNEGAIDKEKVLYISIEDIIRKCEQVSINRLNGLIPDFEKLKESDQRTVTTLAKQMDLSEEDYIKASNAATLAEISRIKEVAQKFGIPVAECLDRRIGHAANPVAQPQRVKELIFNNDGSISQISTLNKEERSHLFSDVRKDPNAVSELNISAILGLGEVKFCTDREYEFVPTNSFLESAESVAEIQQMELLQLNSVPYIFEGAENVIVGHSLNLAQTKPRDITDKGLIAHLSFKDTSKGTTPVTDAYQLIDSESLRAAKFVVLSLTIPENLAGNEREEFLKNRNDIFRKLFADFKIDKPVFITSNSPNEEKLLPIFAGTIDLNRALKPNKSAIVESAEILDVQNAAIGKTY